MIGTKEPPRKEKKKAMDTWKRPSKESKVQAKNQANTRSRA